MIINLPKYLASRPAKFTLVAGLAAAVHLLTAEGLLMQPPAISVFKANCLAFIPAVLVSYLGHRRFTFAQEGSLVRFLLLAVTGFALNNVVLMGVIQAGMPTSLAVLLAAAASPVLMYLGCRRLVFIRSQQWKRPAEAGLGDEKQAHTKVGLRRRRAYRLVQSHNLTGNAIDDSRF